MPSGWTGNWIIEGELGARRPKKSNDVLEGAFLTGKSSEIGGGRGNLVKKC